MFTFLVADYDEAIVFFTQLLGFELVEDIQMDEGKRWVIVSPEGGQASLLLAKAESTEQVQQIGNQAAGRVLFFLFTDDFHRDYQRMTALGIKFKEAPRNEAYGIVAVFEDLYGNLWDLLEPSDQGRS